MSGPKLVVVREPEELEPEWHDIFEKEGCEFKDGILAECGFGAAVILMANTIEPDEYFVFVVGVAMYHGNSSHEATRMFLDQVRIRDANAPLG